MPATQQGRPAVWVVLCLCAIGVGRAQSDELARKSHEAKQLMAAGRFVEAIPLYQELGRALPSITGLRLNLGLAYHMTGRQAEAVPEFERVLKSDPGNGQRRDVGRRCFFTAKAPVLRQLFHRPFLIQVQSPPWQLPFEDI